MTPICVNKDTPTQQGDKGPDDHRVHDPARHSRSNHTNGNDQATQDPTVRRFGFYEYIKEYKAQEHKNRRQKHRTGKILLSFWSNPVKSKPKTTSQLATENACENASDNHKYQYKDKRYALSDFSLSYRLSFSRFP